ncbi:hypothetical protein AN958_01235, partial [Leucoagaricus sp. SymC.cos]
ELFQLIVNEGFERLWNMYPITRADIAHHISEGYYFVADTGLPHRLAQTVGKIQVPLKEGTCLLHNA